MSPDLERLPRESVDRIARPFARFLRIEAVAGAVLLLCAVAALAISNSHWSASYQAFWQTDVGFQWGDAAYSRSIKRWINDAAMTLFFFVVALELKREMALGELRDARKAAFSIAAALGGMLVPAVVFVLLQRGHAGIHGWGVVMATDTAFVIGCLALLGSRIPHSLRLFLLSLAIFDDIGAILVIAIGYGHEVNATALLVAALAVAGIVLLGRMGIRQVGAYAVAGAITWLALDASGIHPTLAGVVIGLMTPARSWVSDRRLQAILGKVMAYPRGEHWSGDTDDRRDLQRAGVATREALSPLERLEILLHPWIAFAVLPAFALANAALDLESMQVDWRLAGAVVVGLLCGKPLGVVLFSYAAVRLRLAARPRGLSWPLLAGGALLTGIGFTMALLISELALAADLLASVKLGILAASVLSALLGLSVLALLTSRRTAGRRG
ncbi:MAG TPA: Na+/H+ antiporter NhaA [Xanthomonadaceae bacterium]|nr:Na+/H+ antiporter NhaA [Xanthomonadaceae bacterium]